MKLKKTTLTLFLAMVSLCYSYSQEFTINVSKLDAGFNIAMQITTAAKSSVTVDWGSGYTETLEVSGAKTFTVPLALEGQAATINISGAENVDYIGIDNKIDKFTVNTVGVNLNEIVFDQCALSDVDLKKATNLKNITITLNDITSIDLSGNSLLEIVKLNGNASLETITWPAGLTSLKTLALNNTKVGGGTLQSALNIAPNIEELFVNKQTSLSDNKLTTINLTNNSKLKDLQLQDNALSGTVDLGTKPELIQALLDGNQIEVFAVNSATVTYLKLHNNVIKTLNVKNVPALESLYCNNNKLSKLDLTGCTAIKNVLVADNELASITFPAVVGLNDLDIKGNLFDFATLPRVAATTYTYTGQKTILSIEASGADYFSVNMSKYMNPVLSGENVPGTAGKKSVIRWYGYDNRSPYGEEELSTGYGDFTLNESTSVYSFSKKNLEDYFLDNKVFAKITNEAFPAIDQDYGPIKTIEIELGKKGVGVNPDKVNTATCYYNGEELVYSAESVNSITVYNLAGQAVLNQTLVSDKGSVNVSRLNKGVYIVQLKGAKESITQKIVKE